MCMMVYVGSESSLPAVPLDPLRPDFHTRPTGSDDSPVLKNIPAEHVIYTGSHEGCGCGFSGADPDLYYEQEEVDAARTSLIKLRGYIDSILRSESRVWLYSVEYDDKYLPAESKRIMTPEEFIPESFYFRSRELIEVHRSP